MIKYLFRNEEKEGMFSKTMDRKRAIEGKPNPLNRRVKLKPKIKNRTLNPAAFVKTTTQNKVLLLRFLYLRFKRLF